MVLYLFRIVALRSTDLRQAKTDVLIPLERFGTLSLDAEAQEQGYLPLKIS